MKFPSVEVEKRDRDEYTDTLIKSLLDEEKSNKKQKRDPRGDAGATQAVTARKGKTFAEIEAEEGGPVKESLVGMAHMKRAQNRNKRDVDVGETDIVADTERYEKDTLEVEEEEGVTFEPFNLKQEREEGYFDEDGNYVLRKKEGEEDDDEKDAWLASEEAKVVSEAVRKKIEEQRARAEAAARRGPLTERQIAQRKADMAAVMQPAETVTRALKRLGGGTGAAAAAMPHRAMGKRERARLLAQQQQQKQSAAVSESQAAAANLDGGSSATSAREQFTRLTELADELLGEGEMEIYGATTEELLRSARMWLPQLAVPPAAAAAAAGGGGQAAPPPVPGGGGGGGGGDDDDDDMFAPDGDEEKQGKGAAVGTGAGAAATAVDTDQDMFADDDEADGGGSGPAGAAQQQKAPEVAASTATATASAPSAAGAGAVGPGSGAAGPGPISQAAAATSAAGKPADSDAVDYGSWPVKELKRLLQERGVDPSGFVEKTDLVSKVKEVVAGAGAAAAGRPAAGGGQGGGGGGFEAPPGYVFDPSSGYFYSEESGMYYDTTSGGYCQAATGKWFYLDPSSGSFVEWKQG